MGSATSPTQTYLGLDLSTQQLKAVVVDENLKILHEASVQFDTDLPEFRTHGGALLSKDNSHVVTAPTLMWVKSVDMILDRLTLTGVDYSSIVAISGTAQQHGSVYWQLGAGSTLKNLRSSEFLHQQLGNSFSINNSPIWMDSSTTQQCKKLEETVGGPQKLAEITGSRAYERFTGSQICKIAENKPEAYHNTERISLISSFLCSIFLGKIAPIDYADGSGMNLMNIRTKKWENILLNVCGPNLEEKLGDPVPSKTNLGNISPYYVERYGFKPDCKIIAFTGDNPASLIGMRLNEGWLAVSLGTSDTVFLWLKEPKVVPDGHILCNPVDCEAYMGLLCFKNGSLTRERIRDNWAEKSWDLFDQLLESTPRGNFGNIGLYYDAQEIIPFLKGDFRFNKAGEKVTKFSSIEVEVRALIEGQFIAQRVYAEDIGFHTGKNTKIIATGGASANKTILQVIADVFNAPVYQQEAVNSAMLGAAYQAKYGISDKSYEEVMSVLSPPTLVCEPFSDAADIYNAMTKRYRSVVKMLIEENN